MMQGNLMNFLTSTLYMLGHRSFPFTKWQAMPALAIPWSISASSSLGQEIGHRIARAALLGTFQTERHPIHFSCQKGQKQNCGLGV